MSPASNASAAAPAVPDCKAHAHFFFNDGNVTFKFPKDGVAFNVHRYHFRESPRFQNDYAPKGQAKEPTTIEITDFPALDFEALLFALYAPIFKDYPHATSDAHWISVLNMAQHWGLGDLRKHTIERLEKLPVEPVQKIFHYRACGVEKEHPAILIPSYVALCEREQPISTAEGHRLELDTVTKLFTVREEVLKSQLASKAKSPEDVAKLRQKLVENAFAAGATPMLNGKK
ncbi:hypothetical protein BOTBODRAFT_28016 [Botryobasidium botryosum FD-172 SS1]|uniref:BTB domain-containing protein n=1 Tax=Botryobasidium botryosum (strain FD-172 SS1) TaxID=930990 RepID=A0A067N5N4_BOTB1|nr:hypothetical protein BOTBODRAFT_28016 [Botryobasidium botryosum FD-172 SS1]